jgi:hypothetical protein
MPENHQEGLVADELVETGLTALTELPPSEPVTKKEAIPDEPAPLVQIEEPVRPETHSERVKREFTEKILASRIQPPAFVAQPPIPRMLDQTKLEMAEGKRMNAHHDALRANRPIIKPDLSTGSMTPVFRPADYVPDPKKPVSNGARTVSRE